MSSTPAGSIPPRRRPRILGALLFTLPIVAALVAAMLLGRRSSPPSPEGHDHALKEVDRAALAVAREPEQVVEILRYVVTD